MEVYNLMEWNARVSSCNCDIGFMKMEVSKKLVSLSRLSITQVDER
jgi:hypothetical protein